MAATVSGFAVIPVSYDSSTTHCLYARSHASGKGKGKAGLPEGRTLFLVNVPPDTTERELRLFFKHAGTVEKVIFGNEIQAQEEADNSDDDDEEDADEYDVVMSDEEEESLSKTPKGRKAQEDQIPKLIPLPAPPVRKIRKTGLTAHIIFLDASSLQRALASTSKPRAWPSANSEEPPHGLAHYKALYASLRPPLDSVKAFADSAMEVYEYDVQKGKRRSVYKKGEEIVDEDGFTLVTRGGAYGKTIGGSVGVASKRFQRSVGQARNRGLKKKEKKEKEGFYSFQKAEKQRAELLELKKKWEEDKARVEKLKASRRFKPY